VNNLLTYLDISEADTKEEQCSGPYYSDDPLKELDGYAFAEQCRDVNGM
jgi:hypothetical protein